VTFSRLDAPASPAKHPAIWTVSTMGAFSERRNRVQSAVLYLLAGVMSSEDTEEQVIWVSK
jgi:hypothetical protein